MSDRRTDIATAVITMLASLTRSEGGYLECVDHYMGELGDGVGLEQVMTRLRGRSPGILVTVGRADHDRKSLAGLRYKKRFQVELAVISNHLTSLEARGIGGAARLSENYKDPGIYQILEDIETALAGRSPSVSGVGKLFPDSEEVVLQRKELSIYAARYSVEAAVCQPRSTEENPDIADSVEVVPELIVEPSSELA